MRWSWQIARVAGIGIYLHITFPLLLIWAGLVQYSAEKRWADVWIGLIFVLLVFVIVVMHELGHALTARRFGIGTSDITLLPIGGVARLERPPEKPRDELLVALAGPAVNVCLAVLCFAIIGGTRELRALTGLQLQEGEFLPSLMWVNVILAVFNLLPAFPMDGGRVLRALLAMRMSYRRATSTAAKVGQAMALLFVILGISSLFSSPLGPFSNPFLALIGLFVWFGAAQESGYVRLASALGNTTVAELMIREFQALSPQDTLGRAAEHLLAGWQHHFPVIEHGTAIGVLTRRNLIQNLVMRGPATTVGEAVARDFETISSSDAAKDALFRLRKSSSPICLVIDEGTTVGILNGEDLNESLLVLAHLARRPEAKSSPPPPSAI